MNVWSFSFLVLVFLSFCTNHTSLEIVAGHYHNCVYEPGQTGMTCWGQNTYGQLGYEDTNNRGDDAGEMSANLPIVALGPNFSVNTTSLGGGHSCAASQEHAVKCWGDGGFYALGHAANNDLGGAAGEMDAGLAFVEFGEDFVPLKVAVGQWQSCVFSTDALLVCFGNNWYGQCGAGTSDSYIIGPPSNISVVDLGLNFTPLDIAAFLDHMCAISQQQTIKCFGRNDKGQLGYGDTTDRGLTAQSMGDGLPVLSLGSNFTPKAVAVGGYHTCALSTVKTVKCFGRNEFGQCGAVTPRAGNKDYIGNNDNLAVTLFPGSFVPMQMALGFYHTCILSESAEVVCFGGNFYGQLGLGHNTSTTFPTLVDLGTGFVPRKLTAGKYHTCAVSTVDSVKCWGRNDDGQLGLGHTNNMGDQPNEMADDLPIVDVGQDPATAPTTAPTTAQPTTAEPPTDEPTTTVPTSAAPTTTTTSSSASPTTATPTTAVPTTTAPTTATPTTDAPTAAPTTAPTTASPTTTAPTTTAPTTTAPTTTAPTTTAPTTVTPTTLPTEATTTMITTTAESETTHNHNSNSSNSNHTVTVTIRTDSLSSMQVLVAIANAHNLSSTLLTITTLSSDDESDDGFATVELLVAVSSNVELDYDVIEATLKEAMVDEYGEDVQVDIDVHGDDDDKTQEESGAESNNFLAEYWQLTVVLCIVSVCFGFAVFGFIKCILTKRRQHGVDNQNQLQAAQIEILERPRPRALPAAVVLPNVYGVHSDSEDEEKKEDIHPDVNPGAGGEPDLELEQSVSNQDEGRRASVAAQTAAVTAGLAADGFEVVGDHETDASHSANFVRAEPTLAGMEEDEFEVVDDDDNQVNTAGHTRSE